MPSPDHFATLSFPRALWLDAETLKSRFFERSAQVHPDAGGSATDFAELNAAWQTLRDPTARLRHYLELEHPAALANAVAIPPDFGDLFMEIATARQQAQQLATRLSAASSPLARGLLAGEKHERRACLESLLATLQSQLDAAHAALAAGDRDPVHLAESLAKMVYLSKWSTQLRESLLTLT